MSMLNEKKMLFYLCILSNLSYNKHNIIILYNILLHLIVFSVAGKGAYSSYYVSDSYTSDVNDVKYV